MTYPTLEHVAMEARPYPAHLLEGCETGLVLFAAAFLGHNDAIHFAEEGLSTVCIDVDSDRLEEMSELYPENWRFVCRDAWDFAEAHYAAGHQWDAVSCDTFTGVAMEKSLKSLDLWASLARRFVTVTLTAGAMYRVPNGFRAYHFTRAPGIYWLVLERE